MFALLYLLACWGVFANVTAALMVISRIMEDRRDVADWQRTRDMIRTRSTPASPPPPPSSRS